MAKVRVKPEDVDMDGYRRFIQTAGAVHEDPHRPIGEIMRFRIGAAFGGVSRRKDGTLTFFGIARRMLTQMTAPAPRATAEAKAVRVRSLTFKAEEHDAVRAVLADADRADVFTDGSCTSGGLGFGGWAARVRSGFDIVEVYGGARHTTVNRMEMTAAIAALKLLPAACAVRVHTDSKYLQRGIKEWCARWQSNGWRTMAGEPVKNEDLWRKLIALTEGRDVKWKWVKSHNGHRDNERADELAKLGRYEITDRHKERAAA